ncbi:hypothetical protein COO60DRAFT_1602071, partial [Scenedesmus sp. NREL 46B-D3]
MLASLFVLLLSCFDKLCSSLALLIKCIPVCNKAGLPVLCIMIIIIILPIQAIATAP